MSDSIIRLVFSIGLIFLGWVVYRLVRSISLHIAGKNSLNLAGTNRASKTIVYFTTPDCVACISAQKPALNQLKETLGNELEVIEINAYEKPELAKEWGVMSVPTTFILDANGVPFTVNYGVTPFKKLLEQINRSR